MKEIRMTASLNRVQAFKHAVQKFGMVLRFNLKNDN